MVKEIKVRITFTKEIIEGTVSLSRDDKGRLALFDYQVKGYFKDACSILARDGSGTESAKLKAYKKIINGYVLVQPRVIPFEIEGGQEVLADSGAIPAGAYVDLTITCLSDEHMVAVEEWLDYGWFRGFGQWRNPGKNISWEKLEERSAERLSLMHASKSVT